MSNIRNYGGILSVTDRARPDSGVLDVCVFSGERVVGSRPSCWEAILTISSSGLTGVLPK